MKEAPPPSVSSHDMHGNGIIKGLTTLLQVRLLRLQLVVVVSAVILAVVVLHGSVQGRSSDNVLRGVMGVAYSMLPVAVSYAVGLIQDGPFHDETFVLWATALLVLQGSAMSASERKLLRIQSVPATGRCQQECVGGQRKKQVLQHVLQTGLVLWLIINMRSRDACYRVVIWMFWALNLVKTVAKMVDVRVGVRDLDRSVTVMIVVITAGLEVFQAVVGFASNWRYVKTVYRCVRDGRDWTHTHLWLWLGRKSITPPGSNNNKSWWERREQKVGQYALLKYFRYRPCNLLSWMTLCLVERRRQGQNPGRTKPLPREARRAVLRTLKQSDGRLTNGVATLLRHGLLPRLAWACRLPKVTDQVLAWHIVTTCCDWTSGHPDHSVDNEHRLVARRLSNYCAYLVAFVPEMLPGPSYSTQQVFDTAVRHARDHLDGCRTQSSILTRLEQIADYELPWVQEGGTYERADNATVIERAAVLWGQLRSVGADDAWRWQVLAEFWAELVLFLAPSDNVEVHGLMLGSGGEFMTQLWVLLSNAGILER
ncbi:hypothetical protein PR202_ga05581 [Eleusine coracana subsp. coracana]|uniref:DUF4220 domain-containing protein n=1 Tax=Eleusine coracana subsp. coracana TaxID=191504 RepID=A0AAV5BUP6_ELECO|nr:hypothetical protein QOZ80_5AG0367670 [Eleusine coracana subsp. coracana]GJM88989.1 hypothetical protein PR202_ga05127 [Eleusine coracana subsp. coracana]GJM89390.1 hypothetical protein PR202_ga05581 [Eleusine coracana subsp. coracana]